MEAGDEFNRSIVLSSLWRDIETLRDQQGLQADFAAFTGDAAFHGLQEEYGLAASEFFHPLLKAANLSRERLFLVPGNHDVEGNKTRLLNNPLVKSGRYQYVCESQYVLERKFLRRNGREPPRGGL